MVSVLGEAGIGKSRLLYELKERLVKEVYRYIEGSCFTYGDVISYLPFLAIVRSLFGLKGFESEREIKRQMDQRLRTLNLESSQVAPYLRNLLSLTVEDEVFPKLSEQLIRQRTVEALKTLVLAEASRQPLVLILEDVHWIDKASEEVLTALVEGMEGISLLLVLVYRPEYLHRWTGKAYHTQISLVRLPSAISGEMVRAILSKPYATRVSLERLSSEQSTAMVQELLGTAEIPEELERLVATRTEGNPLFVEELTRSLLEGGDLVRKNGGYILKKYPEALNIPSTVPGVLLARIDRLKEELKYILQVASAIGRVFNYPILTQVVGARHASPLPGLDEMLEQLEGLEFIYPTSVSPQREYSSKHVLTQEAVYDTLLTHKREVYHEQIGQALETL
ncbi:MAG: AAA family ATPase, partial [Nitrospira sp.]|nr:AAA family ATPase [Nitrospira sp.]